MGSRLSFLYALDTIERGNFYLDLYGVDFHSDQIKNQDDTLLNYKGVFPADEVIVHVEGDFGLVWYGESLDSCDGKVGQYSTDALTRCDDLALASTI